MNAVAVAPEDENDAEVRREDQNNINKFARFNARLHQLRGQQEALKKELETLDDASTELMMAESSSLFLQLGEAFFATTEEDATQFCEDRVEQLQQQVEEMQHEEQTIKAEQNKLKQVLYGRFGKSINLEDD